MARFLHSAPVLSCESKNGGYGRNDKSEWAGLAMTFSYGFGAFAGMTTGD